MPEAKHILTQAEAIGALRMSSADECPNLELLLSAADDSIKTGTGHDWVNDNQADPTAKLAASLFIISVFSGTEIPDTYNQAIIKLDAKAKEAANNG